MKTIVGKFLMFEEFEELCDIVRHNAEAIRERDGTIQTALRVDGMLSAVNALELAAARELREGVLADFIPVYNLGIVDRPKKARNAKAAPWHSSPCQDLESWEADDV